MAELEDRWFTDNTVGGVDFEQPEPYTPELPPDLQLPTEGPEPTDLGPTQVGGPGTFNEQQLLDWGLSPGEAQSILASQQGDYTGPPLVTPEQKTQIQQGLEKAITQTFGAQAAGKNIWESVGLGDDGKLYIRDAGTDGKLADWRAASPAQEKTWIDKAKEFMAPYEKTMLLGALGIGGSALIGKLFEKDVPKFKPPEVTPTPGQNITTRVIGGGGAVPPPASMGGQPGGGTPPPATGTTPTGGGLATGQPTSPPPQNGMEWSPTQGWMQRWQPPTSDLGSTLMERPGGGQPLGGPSQTGGLVPPGMNMQPLMTDQKGNTAVMASQQNPGWGLDSHGNTYQFNGKEWAPANLDPTSSMDERIQAELGFQRDATGQTPGTWNKQFMPAPQMFPEPKTGGPSGAQWNPAMGQWAPAAGYEPGINKGTPSPNRSLAPIGAGHDISGISPIEFRNIPSIEDMYPNNGPDRALPYRAGGPKAELFTPEGSGNFAPPATTNTSRLTPTKANMAGGRSIEDMYPNNGPDRALPYRGIVPGPHSLAATGPRSLAETTPPVDYTQLGPGASGGADLEAALRYALASGRNISDILAGASGRELVTQMEQYPWERRARLASLQQIPELQGTVRGTSGVLETGEAASRNALDLLRNTPQIGSQLYDPIQAGIGREVQRALAGEVANPGQEREFAMEEARVRNQLAKMHGPGWETSSAGIEALQKLRESQNVRKEQFRRETIGQFSPLEFGRRQWNTQFPEQAYTSRLGMFGGLGTGALQVGEGIRGGRMRENIDIAGNFGRMRPGELGNLQGSLAPIPGLLGIGDNSAQRANQGLINDQALREWTMAANKASAAGPEAAKGFGTLWGTMVGGGVK